MDVNSVQKRHISHKYDGLVGHEQMMIRGAKYCGRIKRVNLRKGSETPCEIRARYTCYGCTHYGLAIAL